MNNTPIAVRWEGDCFKPLTVRWQQLCDRAFVIGEEYRMEVRQERSTVAHNHWFACIQTAWENLPAHYAERFMTPEALRKYVLISVGYCDSDSFVASSKAEALRLAKFLQSGEEFTLVTVEGRTVTRYRARSQSMLAMGKKEFQEVKEKALVKLSEMIGTDAATLSKEAA